MPLVLNSSSITGLAAVGGLSSPQTGSVLQVVQTQYSSQSTTSSNVFTDTGLTASITPSSATSKILVFATVNGLEKSNGNNNNSVGLKLVRNSTDLSSYLAYVGWMNNTTTLITPSGVINYLDSPATTSSTTYKVQFRNEQNASAVYVQSSGSISFIVLMEIAG